MIQDIEPRIFDNNFKSKKAGPQDLFLSYEGDKVLIREEKRQTLVSFFFRFPG